MKCKYCNSPCVKNGFQKDGTQRFRCTTCFKRQQEIYIYKIYSWENIDNLISVMVKNSSGIRNISRVLEISATTVIYKIKKIASNLISLSSFEQNQSFELDEMQTYIGNKENRIWIIYSLEKKTKQVIDFVVGRRNSENVKKVVDKVLSVYPKTINTDKLNIYTSIIPSSIHKIKKYETNYIERKNLTLRTNLKRLQRKSICYSKSEEMLIACLSIFLWG